MNSLGIQGVCFSGRASWVKILFHRIFLPSLWGRSMKDLCAVRLASALASVGTWRAISAPWRNVARQAFRAHYINAILVPAFIWLVRLLLHRTTSDNVILLVRELISFRPSFRFKHAGRVFSVRLGISLYSNSPARGYHESFLSDKQNCWERLLLAISIA